MNTEQQAQEQSTIIFWLSGLYQIWLTSKLCTILLLGVLYCAINCFKDMVLTTYVVSRDMSIHELFTIDVGGLSEDDDPY
jgi:hypothetical protein